MCGIVGIYSFKRKAINRKEYINWCLKKMHHRGPDSSGTWQNEAYITGFVRLSIRDLSSNGSQPMLSDCGNYCLTFNGEIYNTDQFRADLVSKGVRFRSTTDTEILLYSLIHYGIEKVLSNFDGMFAFSFYNKQQNKLWIARDRVGIKPLYIGQTQHDFIFSSQYDHIINYDTIKGNSLDFPVLGNYLQLGFVPDNAGIVTNTRLFPHGHYATITADNLEIKEYYNSSLPTLYSALVDEEQLYIKNVRSQLVSDVPVGTFLSGGVDSPLISYWADKFQPVKSFTIRNEDSLLDETENVKQYVKKFGIKNYMQTITEKDLIETIEDNSKAYTEPFADFSSIPSLVVSKHAGKYVKVVLSGDGPDELFWGYARNVKMLQNGETFLKKRYQLLLDYATSKIKGEKTIVNFKRFFNSKTFSDFYFKSLFIYGSEEWLSKIFKHEISEPYFLNKVRSYYEREPVGLQTFMKTVKDLEMHLHLQRILLKVDRASMYHSIEVRVPYLSNEVLDYSNSINYQHSVHKGIGKYNLKKLLMDKVNPEIVLQPKKGFMVPMRNWLRNEIRADVTDKLMNMPSEFKDSFNRKEMELLLKKHMDEKMDYSGIIWALYSLVNWHQEHRNAA